MEQRLLQAQEKLLVTEKQALVAELAGAAAHELNQPLTSVMGYAELLKKKMGPDEPYHRAVDTILAEAARMAEIVKKIGRITKYETKPYVGSAQILDLEKASGQEQGSEGDERRRGAKQR
jgi:signal transduction histidine kinase